VSNQYPSSENQQPEPAGEPTPPAGYQPAPPDHPRQKPVVTYTIMGLTIFVFMLQLGSQTLFNGTDLPQALGMKVNDLIMRGQLWRLFTPMLLHGSILHIGFNMYALYILGPGLERFYGWKRFIAVYILAGFAGNVMSFLFSPEASLGSSTAIFGIFGAEGVFFYQNRKIFGQRAQVALREIVFFAGINLLFGLSPGIDNWGHIGGLIGGVLFAWFGGPLLRLDGIYPSLKLVDDRETGDIIRAGVSVGLLFAALTAATIFLKLR
jgi:rhomboid protease GluP